MAGRAEDNRKSLEAKLAAFKTRREELRRAQVRLEERHRAAEVAASEAESRLMSLMQASTVEEAEAKLAEVYVVLEAAVADLERAVDGVAARKG